MKKVEVGLKAPDFKLQDETEQWRTLSGFKGKIIVLYFYPKDNTPGCTKQACAFRDSFDEYAQNNIVVLGVSYDSPKSHKKFKEKYHLPFILLSDEDKTVSELYGAYSSLLNYFYPNRITFLIDKEGTLIKIFENVIPADNASEILTYLKDNRYIKDN